MKRVLSILLLMLMALPILSACQTNKPNPKPDPNPDIDTDPKPDPDVDADDIPVRTGITGLSFTSSVTALEGTWTVVKVYADKSVSNATVNAITFKISLDLDPFELVDGDSYIHNQVYNLTGIMTFGVAEINTELSADDVDNYRGTAMWDSFVMGKVVDEGGFYEQPGPAIMSFRDIDDYGLYLNLVAGISAAIDTTNKNLIIGMNNDGQLLLGYSSVHLERPSVEGDWEYCLILEKA